MKVSELSGADLDYWVARAEGSIPESYHGRHWYVGLVPERAYTPSTDWAQGGPIIEREEICIEPQSHFVATDHPTGWNAVIHYHGGESQMDEADTPLVAAMRCYVTSKFGDEVAAAKQESGT